MGILKDLKNAKIAEERVKTELEQMGFECELNEEHSERSYYDLTIIDYGTAEIINDLYAKKSGNVAIEYYNPKSDKPSGIAITKSDIWCHIIDDEIFVVRTERLKKFVEEESPKRIVKKAGDGNADLKLYAIEHIMTIFIPIKDIREIL